MEAPVNEWVRALFLWVLRLFYPSRHMRGQAPEQGPCIVVANHPNGLIDPVLLMVALDRPLAFLTKSTLFEMPVIRTLMRIFHGIPVYRPKEGDASRNAETFAAARAVLERGGWLALFPEGTSHSRPELLPLKTGAARIALGGPPGIRIVPVGLTYEDKATFRSAVSFSIGPALNVDHFRHKGGEDPSDVAALTEAIDTALTHEIIEAEDQEIWRGFRSVASWVGRRGEAPEALEARALYFSQAWRLLGEEQRQALAQQARAFAARLGAVGLPDPWLLDAGLPGPLAILRAALPLVLLAPPALLGAVLGWLPYRGIGVLVSRLTQEEEVVATYKLLGGVLFLPLWWVLQAVLLGLWSPLLGLSAGLLGPSLGYVALRWEERFRRRRHHGRAWWLLWTEEGVAETIRAEREALARQVQAALGA